MMYSTRNRPMIRCGMPRFDLWPVYLMVAVGLLMLSTRHARPHDDAAWIARDRYTFKGEWCCGPSDCGQLAEGDVVVREGGFFIKSLNEFVPSGDAIPMSPEGYWRCKRPDGTRRCFFSPSMGS